MQSYRVQPASIVKGSIRVPGDKSISHRSIMLGGIAEGRTEVSGFLASADCLATLEAFRAMGVEVDRHDETSLTVHGRGLHGLRAPGQVLDMGNAGTAIRLSMGLLAGLYAEGETRVTEPAPTRDHTERMLRGFGLRVDTDGPRVSLRGAQVLHGTRIEVPGDISSAAFFLVAGCLAGADGFVVENVGINPTRTGVIDILRLMGADLRVHERAAQGGEPVADIELRRSALRGIAVPESLVPLAIDELPVLFIAAAAASGETVFSGAAELRVKESDRLAVMADGLT